MRERKGGEGWVRVLHSAEGAVQNGMCFFITGFIAITNLILMSQLVYIHIYIYIYAPPKLMALGVMHQWN